MATPYETLEQLKRYQMFEDFFVYGATFATIAANAVQNVNINIDAGSAFKWCAATMQCDLAGAAFTESAAPVPLCALQITDTGSGRQLFNQAQPLSALFGNGQLPFILPQPRGFMPNSNVSLQLSNFSAATTYTVRLALIGTKVFAGGGNAP
jgi:hypothetical protein